MTRWNILQDQSSEYMIEVEDPDGWRSATVKWDGCIHYYRYYNTPKGLDAANDEECDYIHLCDIDDEIARLQALKRLAYTYFEQHGRADHSFKPDVVEGTVVKPAQLPEPRERHAMREKIVYEG